MGANQDDRSPEKKQASSRITALDTPSKLEQIQTPPMAQFVAGILHERATAKKSTECFTCHDKKAPKVVEKPFANLKIPPSYPTPESAALMEKQITVAQAKATYACEERFLRDKKEITDAGAIGAGTAGSLIAAAPLTAGWSTVGAVVTGGATFAYTAIEEQGANDRKKECIREAGIARNQIIMAHGQSLNRSPFLRLDPDAADPQVRLDNDTIQTQTTADSYSKENRSETGAKVIRYGGQAALPLIKHIPKAPPAPPITHIPKAPPVPPIEHIPKVSPAAGIASGIGTVVGLLSSNQSYLAGRNRALEVQEAEVIHAKAEFERRKNPGVVHVAPGTKGVEGVVVPMLSDKQHQRLIQDIRAGVKSDQAMQTEYKMDPNGLSAMKSTVRLTTAAEQLDQKIRARYQSPPSSFVASIPLGTLATEDDNSTLGHSAFDRNEKATFLKSKKDESNP